MDTEKYTFESHKLLYAKEINEFLSTDQTKANRNKFDKYLNTIISEDSSVEAKEAAEENLKILLNIE